MSKVPETRIIVVRGSKLHRVLGMIHAVRVASAVGQPDVVPSLGQLEGHVVADVLRALTDVAAWISDHPVATGGEQPVNQEDGLLGLVIFRHVLINDAKRSQDVAVLCDDVVILTGESTRQDQLPGVRVHVVVCHCLTAARHQQRDQQEAKRGGHRGALRGNTTREDATMAMVGWLMSADKSASHGIGLC